MAGNRTTVAEVAEAHGLDARLLKRKLRAAKLAWFTHRHGGGVARGGAEHADIERVAKQTAEERAAG